ncbi:MAG: hypothetical protein CME20_15095, partial [Gemmatimonadetes bacterium]|nr:hypothetical protein [Gemmatimonadota bacterium]
FGPDLEEIRGTVGEFDLLNGVLRLAGTPMRIADEAVFLDGSTGESLDYGDLEKGEGLYVRVLWSHAEGGPEPIIIEAVRNAGQLSDVPVEWVEVAGVVEKDGERALLVAGRELLVAFDAPVFLGPDATEIDQADIKSGASVALGVRYDEFGEAVVAVHINPPRPPDRHPEGSTWDMVNRIYDIDAHYRYMRLENWPQAIDEDTEFFDAFGFEIGPEDLFPGDALVLWVDHSRKIPTVMRVEIQDPERHYEFEDNPEIVFYFAHLARIEEGENGEQLLITYDPYGRPISLDALVLDEQTGEDLTAEIRVEDLVGQVVRMHMRHRQPGEAGPGDDLIVEIGLNPNDQPLGPGQRPEPTEFYDEWEDLGVLGFIDLRNREIARRGIRIIVNRDTEIFDENGARLFIEEVEKGAYIGIDPLATRDLGVVLAREILVNPSWEDDRQYYEWPRFTSNVLYVDGNEIQTENDRFFVEDATSLFDGVTGEELALEDFSVGDPIAIRVQNTDIGAILTALERDPDSERFGHSGDNKWEGDFEVFSVNRETGEVRFAGPPVSFIGRTKFFNRDGREISIDQIPLGEPIVINQTVSATGGPPIARSVEIQNYDTSYDGPTFFFTNFAGIEGDQILTVDHPRYLAVDAELINGNISDIKRGTRVRVRVEYPTGGMYSPFGDVITRLEVDPKFGGEGGPDVRPVETGDISGLVYDIDFDQRRLELEPIVIRTDFRTEVVDAVDRADLDLDALMGLEGELVAVNVSQEFDGRLLARRVTLLDPLRVPTPLPELIVAPLQAVDPDGEEIFLKGLVAAVTDEDTKEIRLADGSLGTFADIQIGDEVRMQIVEGDEGAVISRIKVAGGFEGPIFGGGGLEIVSTYPGPDEAFVPLSLELEVTFNEAIRDLLADEDFDIGLFPPVDFDLDLSRDGRTVILSPDENLGEDTVYQLFVESGRFGRFTLNFTTGAELPQGGIMGRIDARDIPFELIAPEQSGVFLLDAEVLGDIFAEESDEALDVAAEESGEALDEEAEDALFDAAFVAAAPFDQGGVYRFENLPNGDYFVFATVVLEFGPGDELYLEAFLDEDGDGEMDPVAVRGGLVDQVDLSVLPPEPLAVDETFPVDGAVEVDAETEIEIVFSEPLRFDFDGVPVVDGVIFPKPLSGQFAREDVEISEDGSSVSIDVELEEDTNYSLMLFHAENESGLGLEEPVVVHFSTGAGGGEFISGRLGLPDQLPDERVIQRPALLALIPFRDFDPLDPDVKNFAVAGALSYDGFYEFEGVSPGRYVVMAQVNVELPRDFRLGTRGLNADFLAFEREGRFGREVPPDFVGFSFFGYSEDEAGDVRDDVRAGSEDIDILLRPEDVRRSALRVLSVSPSPEDLQEAPEVIDIAVEFSEPLIFSRNFVELEALMRPEPLSGSIMRNFDIEEDGRIIVFRDIELESGAAYKFSIPFARGVSDQDLAEPYSLVVRTLGAEELVLGSVSGTVKLEGDEISEGAVILYDPDDDDLEGLAGALVEGDGTFLIESVVEGEYAAYLELETVSGLDILLLYEGDPFLVSGGETAGIDFSFVVEVEEEIPAGEPAQLTLDAELDLKDELAVEEFKADFVDELAASLGIDPARIFVVELAEGSVQVTFIIAESEDPDEPAPSEVLQSLDDLVDGDLGSLGAVVATATKDDDVELISAAGPNAGALVTLDLDENAGDQGRDKRELAAGETISISVYGSGLQDLTGVSLGLSFDPEQLTFEEALSQGTGEANLLLSQEEAIPLFLPARLRENADGSGASQVEYGGAILSPTGNTAANGQGLLGILRFTALEGYSGATVTLAETIFNSLGGTQDTLQTRPTALLTPPLDLLSTEKGTFSFDFDPGSATLFHRGEVEKGEEINVEVYINDISQLVNYSITLLFDPEQLNYVTWSGQNFLASSGGLAIELDPLVTEESANVGGAILGPAAEQAVSGSHLVGSFTFSTKDAFTETDLVLVSYSTKAFGGEQVEVESSIFARLTTEVLSSATAAGATNADFDGDGSVGFGDFFLFADAFGAVLPDLRYDLDGDGDIGFGDFFVFADVFGGFGKQVALDDGLALEGALALAAESTAEGIRIDLASHGLALRGYAAVIEYDPRSFRFVEASDRRSALRGGRPALLMLEEAEGRVLVSGSRTAGAGAVEGPLAELYFAPLHPESEGVFRIREARVRTAAGDFGQVLDLDQLAARQTPAAFALQPNFPNPFNPATTIPYQLAVDAPVRLEVFDILGQKIKTLVAENQPAGFHRAVWDSRDDGGRPVAAGVYFYRLQAGDFNRVRKLLLLK